MLFVHSQRLIAASVTPILLPCTATISTKCLVEASTAQGSYEGLISRYEHDTSVYQGRMD